MMKGKKQKRIILVGSSVMLKAIMSRQRSRRLRMIRKTEKGKESERKVGKVRVQEMKIRRMG